MRYLSLFSGIEAASVAWDSIGWEPVAFAEFDAFPKAVLKHRYPDVLDLGDVTQITEEQIKALGPIDIVVGGSPCFVAGTKVVVSGSYKNIEDVKIGDMVLTHTGNYKPVLRVGNTKKNTILLNAQGMMLTETTQNHPYYVRTRSRKWNNNARKYDRIFSEPYWKEAGNLAKDDFVSIPIINKEKNPRNLDKETCWIIGRYIADGHIAWGVKCKTSEGYRHPQIILSIGKDKLCDIPKNITSISYSLSSHGKGVYRARICNKNLVSLIKDLGCGEGAINKNFPMELLELPKEFARSILDGYMSGDGSYIKKYKRYQANSVSKELMMELQLLIAKLYGINSSIYPIKTSDETVIEGRIVNQRDYWELHYNKEVTRNRVAFIENGKVWVPVKSIVNTGEIKTVYNLEVADDNSYTANNIIVHNCQDLSIAGKRAGLRNENGGVTRSGLFNEQMRIFEIARKYNGARYCLWENVPGAFSSNNGNDFAYVLGSMACGSVSVPEDGWKNSGVVVNGNGKRCIEWRMLDAQYFGVPQRRRRIFALLDTGEWWSRQPILFESESKGRNPETCGIEREEIAGGVKKSIDGNNRKIGALCARDYKGVGNQYVNEGKLVVEDAYAVRTAQTGANGIGVAKNVSHTLDCANGQAICIPLDMRNANRKNDIPGHECGSGIGKDGDPVNTIATCFIPAVCTKENHDVIACASKQLSQNISYNKANPLCADDYKEPQVICYENHPNDSRVTRCDDGICPTLSSRMGTGGGNVPFIMSSGQANAEINGGGICPTLNCLHEAPILVSQAERKSFQPLKQAWEKNNG